MVTVPRLTENRIEQRGLPTNMQNISVPNAAFGGATARALQQSSDVLDSMANNLDDLQRRQDDAYALDIKNRMEQELNGFTYDPESGLLTKQGLNGMNAKVDMTKKLDELKKKYLNVKGTVALQKSLKNQFTDIETRYTTLASRHATNEINSYEAEVLESRRKIARDEVATNFYDQELFNKKYGEIVKSLNAEKARLGKSDEWLQQRSKEEYSALRVSQIKTLAQSENPQDVLLADEILKEASNKGHLTLQGQQLAEKSVKPYVTDAIAKVSLSNIQNRGPEKLHSFDGAVGFIVRKLEEDPNDPGKITVDAGGETIMGISAKAHPESVQYMKGLVNKGDIKGARDYAKAIYKKDYWDAHNIEELPEHLRMVALSTVINHASGFKKKVLNGIRVGKYTTVQQIMELRNAEYIKLARNDPDGTKGHRDQLKGWQNRLRNEMKATQVPITASQVVKESQRLKKEHGPEAADALIKQYESAAKVSRISQLENEDKILEMVFNEDAEMSTPEKIAEVNRQEVRGIISDDSATKARRYLTSVDKINSESSPEVMADLITRIYDLNSIADMSSEDYLTGIKNIRLEIAGGRADGLLSKDNEKSLNNQIKTLTSSKVSEATNMVAISFGKALEVIEMSLPPELRGTAVRDLFYETEEERMKSESDEEYDGDLKQVYKTKAAEIVDRLSQGRREQTFQAVQKIDADTNTVANMLKEKGYTMDDVRETARKYDMTEQQVINRLAAQ